MANRHRQTRNASNESISASTNVVGTHYKVGRKIGEGSFGIIYEGLNLTNNQQVAIKFESRKSDAPQLRDEYKTYKILADSNGIPNAYYFGQEGLYSILVIDILGPSLEDLFDMCSRKFSIKTVAMLAKQMITRVQSIHEHNLIYRDIKPDNFLIGKPNTKNANTIYMIDFGMAKLYRDPKTKQHIPYRERKSLSGTARYMSINTHLGREQSRRDDLESLGHVFMYFLRGALPWQGLKAATNKQKYERIGEKKQTTQVKDLCDGFPDEFGLYLQYTRHLKFEEDPNYEYLKCLFDKVLESLGEKDDGIYDWMLLNDGKGWEYCSSSSLYRYRQQQHQSNNAAVALHDITHVRPKQRSYNIKRQQQQQQQQQRQQQRQQHYKASQPMLTNMNNYHSMDTTTLNKQQQRQQRQQQIENNSEQKESLLYKCFNSFFCPCL